MTSKIAQLIQKCMFWALKPKQKWDFFIKKAFFYLFLKQVGQATITSSANKSFVFINIFPHLRFFYFILTYVLSNGKPKFNYLPQKIFLYIFLLGSHLVECQKMLYICSLVELVPVILQELMAELPVIPNLGGNNGRLAMRL